MKPRDFQEFCARGVCLNPAGGKPRSRYDALRGVGGTLRHGHDLMEFFMIYLRILMVLAIGLLASLSVAQSSGSEGSPTPAWIARSNQNAKLLLEVVARYSPEAASDFGLEGYDDQVVDYRPNFQVYVTETSSGEHET